MSWNFRQNIGDILVKYRRYIGKISEISEIYHRYFQKIDRAFDFLTNNLTVRIHFFFDPKVQISSVVLKASKDYILDPAVDFKFEA